MAKQNRKNSRYTLVELMMVLVIVIAIVSIGILVAPLVTRQASEAKTKALLGMIENAIEEYKGSNLNGGNYPMSPQQHGGEEYGTRYTPFFIDNYDINNHDEDDNQNIKYNMMQFFDIEQLSEQLSYMPDAERFCINDGFGMPFLYMAPGYRMTGGYDLASTGANLMPGNVDSVRMQKDDARVYNEYMNKGYLSVEHSASTKYAEQLGEGDDITNFMAR